MADSDDEYDRKRRDKFRGERSAGGAGGAGGVGGGDSYRSDRRDDRRGGGGGGGLGGRDEWPERNPFRGGAGGRPRPDYRDYRGSGPRDRYGSPGREMPPAKRMRPDWGDDLRGNPRYGGYDPYLMHAWNDHYASHGMHGGYGPHHGHSREPPMSSAAAVGGDTQTQPAMMTLKQFLDTQDDGISDSEVLRKYTDYKLEFKRHQLNEFFVAHKDEEWFKNKYHPLDSVKRKDEQLNFLTKRVEVFKELLDNGQIKNVSIDTSQTEPLLRLLDTVVIKLEGGTEEDLKILDEKPKEMASYPERLGEKRPSHDDDVIITSVEKKAADDTDDEPKVVSPGPRGVTKRHGSDSGSDDDEDDEEAASVAAAAMAQLKEEPAVSPGAAKKKEKKSLKRKRTNTDSSSSSSSDSDSSSSSSSDDEDDDKLKSKYDLEGVDKEPLDDDKAEATQPAAEEKPEADENGNDEQDEEMTSVKEDAAVEPSNDNGLGGAEGENAEKTEKDEDNALESGSPKRATDKALDESADNEEKPEELAKGEGEEKAPAEMAATETIDLDKEKEVTRPRALHRTSSIFLRNLAPSIMKSEIEAVCQKFEGYLRVAIADPLVERRWYRRGWVTFKRDVNIKEICWNLNNTRLRDCEMGAIVNRDLSRRVRPVNGMTAHKTVVRADIKLCAKIAMNLDERFKLWEQRRTDAESNGSEADDRAHNSSAHSTYGFKSNNPVLQNIADFLIEEASAEEDELLGMSGGSAGGNAAAGGDNKEGSDADGIERDPQLLSVLDCLVLYLRIVHSVDFYNHCEYPYEDEMPNRCGIIHARGPPPSKVSPNDLQDYIKNFDNKMQQFLQKSSAVEEEELKNLGCKDAEAEVEKFVQANTQELAKDKWLCPLSGKKFKGPEFIRKHIFNKHAEKVDEVRKEVEFFNNYLKDPKRPQLPEHPGNSKRHNSESSGGGGGYRPPMYPVGFPAPYTAYAPPVMMPGRGGRGFGGGGGGRRKIMLSKRTPQETHRILCNPLFRELPVEHQRRIIGYHDLDAPSNFDMFD